MNRCFSLQAYQTVPVQKLNHFRFQKDAINKTLIHILVIIFLGLTYNSGHPWKTLRRFTLQALRDFGVGKLTLEERIREEILVLSAILKDANNSPIRMKPYLLSAATNIICSVMFGARCVHI